MKLSIIIISYNEAEYLSRAINSCLNQEEFPHDFEIIIGDDGSNDESLEIILEHQKNYPNQIKYFVQERTFNGIGLTIPSIRVSNTIKRAMSMATGEYFCILSGDDYICDSTKFQKQVDFLDTNPQYVASLTSYKKVFESGEADINYLGNKINWRRGFWARLYFHISCFIFRRSVFDNGYILPNFCDDTGLIYSIMCAGRWVYLPEVTFAYRQRSHSIMHETDQVELCALEVLLYEDCLYKKKFAFSTASRFSGPFDFCMKHKDSLNDEKYKKYLEMSAQSKSKFLYRIANYANLSFVGKLSLRIRLCFVNISRFFYRALGVLLGNKMVVLTDAAIEQK